jgi:hypothetical protein
MAPAAKNTTYLYPVGGQTVSAIKADLATWIATTPTALWGLTLRVNARGELIINLLHATGT